MAITFDTRGSQGRKRMAVPASSSLAERTRAFAAARRHSRLVRFLRTMLPLATVGILVAYGLTLAFNVTLSKSGLKVSGVTVTADDLTMKDPSYFGVSKDGGRYEVRAKRAIVGLNQNAPIKLIDVSGDLLQTNNVTTKLKAKHGLFDNTKGELELFDGIDIDGSNGLVARLSRAMVYSKESRVVSQHPVTANTPTGSVRSSAMTMDNKKRTVQFRGDVAVRLTPSAQGQVGIGADGRQPVDIASDELDIDDAQKTANFRGNVVAVQGETTMNTPYLLVKYEGKAAGGLAATSAPKQAGDQGTRVTFLWARSGVVINAGNDRRVTSDQADFNAEADTALFVGNVVVKQDKNVLQGQRLFVDRKAAKSRLESPGEGNGPPRRIAATFYQGNAGAAAQAKPKPTTGDAAQEALFGSFKTDPNAPMEVEADTLDILDTSKQAIFNGSVKARQGDFVIRSAELTAFYSGQAGLGLGNATDATGTKGKGQTQGQLLRMEAKRNVLITSKDDQTAKADWANFDVKANTALLGGGVVVVKGKDIAEGPLLKIDLTTGFYRFEDTGAVTLQPKQPQAPATSSTSASGPDTAASGACPPGRQCLLVYPKDAKEKAKDLLLKKAPTSDAR